MCRAANIFGVERLQIMLGLLLLSAACGDGSAGATGSAPPPSNANEAVAANTSTAKPAQSEPASAQTNPAAAMSAAVDTAHTSTAPASSPSSMTMTTAMMASAAGSSAQAPDGPSSSGSAGAATQPAAGSGGEAAAAGAGGDAAPMAMLTEDGIDPLNPDWSKRKDLGKGDGSDVVTIGDSWMDYVGGGGGIQAGLDRAGFNYRHYALSGTTLLSGQIPGQYTQAKSVNPDIKTVIMTGGGNDVMFSGGCNTAELCEMSVMRIQEGLQMLWSQMADDGVKDVIYIQYAEDAGTAPMGTRPKSTKPVPICLTGRILCHSVPTTDIVMGQLVDGIHPTLQANDRIAAQLVKIMEERKMRR